MHTILLPTSIHNSTGTDPTGWRAWWATESAANGSDWQSIITAHLIVDQLRDADDADARMGCSS